MTTPSVATPSLAQSLVHTNLSDVFSEPDAGLRLAAAKRLFHSDARFYEPDGMLDVPEGYITGPEGIANQAGKLVDERPGWKFVPAGIIKKTANMVHAPWSWGPVGQDGKVEVKATGLDVFLVRGDKIESFWVVIDGVSDVVV